MQPQITVYNISLLSIYFLTRAPPWHVHLDYHTSSQDVTQLWVSALLLGGSHPQGYHAVPPRGGLLPGGSSGFQAPWDPRFSHLATRWLGGFYPSGVIRSPMQWLRHPTLGSPPCRLPHRCLSTTQSSYPCMAAGALLWPWNPHLWDETSASRPPSQPVLQPPPRNSLRRLHWTQRNLGSLTWSPRWVGGWEFTASQSPMQWSQLQP